MKDIRLEWEPVNKTPLSAIETRMLGYTKGQGGITILGNGTLLSLTKGEDDVEDARKAMNEARFITDFRVIPLNEGGFMVAFHDAVAVFVGEDEYHEQRSEIVARLAQLRFPGEALFAPQGDPPENLLVGLYARGKLQKDAYDFHFYKRI